MTALFVAGAGTDVGKTYVCELLLRAARLRGRRVRALKPVASGTPSLDDPAFAASDVARLLRAAGTPIDAAAVDACSPWRFTAPLSPDMAARAEGRATTFATIAAWTRAAMASNSGPGMDEVWTLVEGVGGLMSPICEDATNLDLAAALDRPILIVAGSYLGAISHAATAWECARLHGLRRAGLVVSETAGSPVDLGETARAIARFARGAEVVALPRGAEESTPPLATLVAF